LSSRCGASSRPAVVCCDSQGGTPLIEAALEGSAHSLELLLDAGASIEAKTREGLTALLAAAAGGFQRCIAMLLARGADVTVQGVLGLTPLHFAAERGAIGCCQLLLAATNGTVVATTKNADGLLPIHVRGCVVVEISFLSFIIRCSRVCVRAAGCSRCPFRSCSVTLGSFWCD
jgi:ankyrin repeat protein